jgi:transposase
MMHLQAGREYDEIALFLGVKKEAVKGWIKRFRKEGLDGLKESPRSGAKRKLLTAQDAEFKASVLALQEEREGGRITGKDVQTLLQDKFKVNCVLSSAYNYLHRVDLSWITVRSKHPKQDQEKQDAFKKTSPY